MNASSILLELIKEFEGCELTAYQCPAGVWTIGFGQTHGIKKGMVWTQDQADADLLKTAAACLDQALKCSPVLKLETVQRQAAIADFIYNAGVGNYNKSTLKIRVGQRNWSSAAIEINKWNKGAGVVLAGLVKRRAKEATLLLA